MNKKLCHYLNSIVKTIKRYPFVFVIGFFLIIACVIFKEFVINGFSPFPGSFLQAWYEPWKSLHYKDGTILLIHKPVAEDVFRHLLPFRLMGTNFIKNLQLPLWNPYNGSGMPLMATINSGFLDPFNILFATLGPNYGYGAYVMIQFIVIGFLTFLYLRSIGLKNIASLLAAVFFVFSGFVTVRLIFLIYGLAIASLPFSLYLVEKYKKTKNKKYLFTLPFVIALLIVTTQTQIAVYILGVLTLYAIIRLIIDPKEKTATKSLLFYFIMTLLGFGLAGLQLLPTFELMQLGHISPKNSFDVIEKFLVPLEHLLTIPIPNYFGSVATYNYWGIKDYTQTVAYLGIFPIFLGLLSLFKVSRDIVKIRNFFAILAILSILLAIDWPGARMFYKIPIPIISTGGPGRIFLLTTFSLTVLSAIGFDYLLKIKKLPVFSKRLSIITSFFVIGILIVNFFLVKRNTVCRSEEIYYCWQVSFRNTALAVAIFFSQLFSLGLVVVLPTKKHLAKMGLLLIFAITILSGIYNSRKYFPVTPTKELFPTLPIIEALKEKTTSSRVFGIGQANIATDLATQFQIYDPQFYHPLYIYRYRELLEYANNGKYIAQYPRGDASLIHNYEVSQDLANRRERFLNLDSVRFRLYKKQEISYRPYGSVEWQDDNWLLTSTDRALSRAYLVNNITVKKTPSEILSTLFDPDFDIFNNVVLEQDISLIKNNSDNKDVIIDDYQAHQVKLITESENDTMLVLTDNYYPGWKAYVDGKPTQIYRANYTFRAVAIPKGTHNVIFRYEPQSVKKGLLISVLSLVLLLILYRKNPKTIN